MLTVWPEGGECVGKCVCLHLSPTAILFLKESRIAKEELNLWHAPLS